MHRWIAAALAALSVLIAGVRASQDYPNRVIHAITNLSAGGISDIFMRGLGEELRKRWGQTVVVENRPGGSYNIGVRACADAPPDGYTICILLSDALVYNPHLFKSLPFDERALQPVMNLFLAFDPDAGGELAAPRQDDRRAGRIFQDQAEDAELPERVAGAGALHGEPCH